MRKLVIIGTSGLAREVAQLARQLNRIAPRWDFLGYIAAAESEVGATLTYGKVIGTDEWLHTQAPHADAVIAVGHPAIRRRIAEYFRPVTALQWPNLVHPTAQVDTDVVELGVGNVVTRNCVMTCDIKIGDFNYFNWGTTVGHDVRVGSYNVINPSSNLSGFVRLHDETLVGVGAQILEHLSVASRTTIGAGAVVTQSIDVAGGTYVGVPAKLRA